MERSIMKKPMTRTFMSATGLGPIHVNTYPISGARGVVQICHGMLEHFGRYDAFARYLNKKGYAVTGFDYAGHGRSTPDSPRGFFGDRDGYIHLVEDIRTLQTMTAAQYPHVPYILLGHSMGSFLARAFCARYGSDLDGAIFMGTSGMGRLMPTVGRCILYPFPNKRPLMFYRAMTFGGFNKRIEKPCDPFAWISRDTDVVEAFKSDPLRIPTFTARGFYDLMSVLREIAKPSWYASIPKDLPILLIAGEEDPVGQYGKGVQKVANGLKNAGVNDVSVQLYPACRHEVLNERNRDEVWADIAAWLNQYANAPDQRDTQEDVIA